MTFFSKREVRRVPEGVVGVDQRKDTDENGRGGEGWRGFSNWGAGEDDH